MRDPAKKLPWITQYVGSRHAWGSVYLAHPATEVAALTRSWSDLRKGSTLFQIVHKTHHKPQITPQWVRTLSRWEYKKSALADFGSISSPPTALGRTLSSTRLVTIRSSSHEQHSGLSGLVPPQMKLCRFPLFLP
jgi:hypothetical protein